MKSAGKARSNGLYRHIRTSKEIIRNLLNDSSENSIWVSVEDEIRNHRLIDISYNMISGGHEYEVR